MLQPLALVGLMLTQLAAGSFIRQQPPHQFSSHTVSSLFRAWMEQFATLYIQLQWGAQAGCPMAHYPSLTPLLSHMNISPSLCANAPHQAGSQHPPDSASGDEMPLGGVPQATACQGPLLCCQHKTPMSQGHLPRKRPGTETHRAAAPHPAGMSHGGAAWGRGVPQSVLAAQPCSPRALCSSCDGQTCCLLHSCLLSPGFSDARWPLGLLSASRWLNCRLRMLKLNMCTTKKNPTAFPAPHMLLGYVGAGIYRRLPQLPLGLSRKGRAWLPPTGSCRQRGEPAGSWQGTAETLLEELPA